MAGNLSMMEQGDQIRAALERLLRRAGSDPCATKTSRGGLAGLHEISARVVLDLLLPDGDGIQALRTVRKTSPQTAAAADESVAAARTLNRDAIFGTLLNFQDFASWLIATDALAPAFDARAQLKTTNPARRPRPGARVGAAWRGARSFLVMRRGERRKKSRNPLRQR